MATPFFESFITLLYCYLHGQSVKSSFTRSKFIQRSQSKSHDPGHAPIIRVKYLPWPSIYIREKLSAYLYNL